MTTEEKLREGLAGTELRENEPMSEHTTFRAGGPARFFAVPKSEEELLQAAALCRRLGMPFVPLGRGSNVLVSDAGYDGLVLSLGDALAASVWQGTAFTAGAGITLAALAREACERSLTGLEFAAGIPGTLGGAVIMNAGAYGGEMKDVLTSVRILDRDGQVREIPAGEMDLRYRGSRAADEGWIVLSAAGTLAEGDRDAVRARMAELAQRRRDKQPLEYPSAGSTFKRPAGAYAGALIEGCGLAGFTVGGAQVSEKHCGFVINRGGATASEIYELCCRVQQTVEEQTGYRLEREVKLLGSF